MAKHEEITYAENSSSSAPGLAPFIPQLTIGAFATSDVSYGGLKEAAADRRMARATLTCHRGDIEAAIARYAAHPIPDLLVIEVQPDSGTLFTKLDELAALCPPDVLIVLLGSSNDVGLYRKLMRSGISEYLVTPVTPLVLIEAIGTLFEDESAERKAPVTAFFGARGGCGASALAQNTAWSIAQSYDTSVLLIDLDLAAGTCALRLDLDAATTVISALSEGSRLDKAVLDRMILRKDKKFALLASPADLTDICVQDRADIRRLIDVARTMASHIVLDLPSGWSRYTESFLEIADQTVLVAVPDLVSLRNCGRIARAMRGARPNDPPPRLVLSQVGLPRSRQIQPEQFGKSLEMVISATIPFDSAAFSGAENEGRPVVHTFSAGIVGSRIDALAGLLTGQKEAQSTRRRPSLLHNLRSLFS